MDIWRPTRTIRKILGNMMVRNLVNQTRLDPTKKKDPFGKVNN